MAQVTRVFATQAKAARAVADLKEQGFNDSQITTVGPPPDAGDDKTAAVSRSLAALGVGQAFTALAAPKIAGGAAAVSVAAPFGWASRAEAVLADAGPDAIDAPDMDPPTRQSTLRIMTAPAGASASATTGRPLQVIKADPPPAGAVEIENDPAPLSRKLGWPVLVHGAASSETELLDEPAPLSAKFGWSVLSAKPPNAALLPEGWSFSARIGWGLLSDHSSRASTVLSDDPTPLSTRFGWKTLIDDPAPLSAKAGWRTLLSDPSPLSRMLGWPVLSLESARAAMAAVQMQGQQPVTPEPAAVTEEPLAKPATTRTRKAKPVHERGAETHPDAGA
jgi:hypothetical protein